MNMQEARTITVNQLGYPATGKKIAVFTSPTGPYQIINESGDTVYDGITTVARFDPISGTTVCYGDFSDITTKGKYQIKQGNATSSMFEISSLPYQSLHHGLLKAFYFFRCGMELDEKFAGPWKHKACHTAEGIVHGEPDRKRDSSGGWHDAGDYGKYTVAAAKAIADLLLAYELYPSAFDQAIPIPETDGQTPDLLHECRYELEWLLKMQDEKTGGVFHKLTTLRFPGLDVMPEDDHADLYFSPISATSTGAFSAIMAIAARIYRPFDSSFADLCLEKSVIAANWLENNLDVPGFTNPSDVHTGEYGDDQDKDERYWAMAELYRTTGKQKYHDAFLQLAQQSFNKYSLGWADVSAYGTLAYLLNGEKHTDPTLFATFKTGLIAEANTLVTKSETDGYLISLSEQQYVWGSNMIVMNHAMILLLAHHFTDDDIYEDCALEHVHYLLGRNVHDISFVTGFGDRSVMHPHHRPSVGDVVFEPVPGLVSGGPDRNLDDEYVRETLQGKSAAQCFVDHKESYSTNEVTIYWNSPAVFVVSVK
ncbi:glycoside hydrolase family 9 protein [Aquibacillus koreensis]|uniref:Endoglucanase n=1 Tax=Aquibacillus koreensis TaxID=279446 RepID=A0A9X3WLV0_9BACI|nr:glycoside hydrolase family 9 protein [Aquibacillus koreensis]MCT2535134.1 glycoside hydrolase family 9 protein [Aquibacillus koreensis]MDC3420993.1 glycoside hydrolase family 9 protein [Aquibacillus koreensis]